MRADAGARQEGSLGTGQPRPGHIKDSVLLRLQSGGRWVSWDACLQHSPGGCYEAALELQGCDILILYSLCHSLEQASQISPSLRFLNLHWGPGYQACVVLCLSESLGQLKRNPIRLVPIFSSEQTEA